MPIPSGEIPKSQWSGEFSSGDTNLKRTMYAAVNRIPTSIPATAPSRVVRFEKIPRMIAGKNEDAASPNANATTSPTKPGGSMPR